MPTPRLFLGLGIALGALTLPLVAMPSAQAAEVINCYDLRPYRDLNGDGYEDAVVGDPLATVGGQPEAGTVTVLFGDADGRIGEGSRRVLTQADLGGTPEAGDHFGWATAIDLIERDGCYSIMIGAPGEDLDGHRDAGVAHTYTFNGAQRDDAQQRDVFATYDQSDVGGTVEDGDEFGSAVASVGGRDEYEVVLAFGAPGENHDAGVINHTSRGQTPARQQRQGAGGVPGAFQAGDRFGETIGFFHYLPSIEDDDWNLYVGAPGDVVKGHKGAGSVTVLSRFAKPRLITQNTSGVPGTAEAGDHFGASLAGNSVPPLPTSHQLAIGSPGEDLGRAKDAGTVTVLKRASATNKVLPATLLSQSTRGWADTAESGDQFGAAVAYRDDRTLAVGVPGENLGSVVDAGIVQIVRVGTSKLSFPSPTLNEDSPGTPGTIKAHSRFGSRVAGLPATDVMYRTPPAGGYGESVFAITSGQDGGSVYVVSSDSATAPRSWKPGTGGIPGIGVRFGRSVA